MGSNCLISVGEAANLVDVTPKTIYNYVKRGLLQPHYQKRRGLKAPLLVSREDLLVLVETLPKQPSFSELYAKTIQAHTLAKTLERRVQHLEKILGSKLTPHPLDAEAVTSLLLEVKEDLESPPIDAPRLEYWTATFMSLNEEFFEFLEAATGDKRAWRYFHTLSKAIMEEMPLDHLKFDVSLREVYNRYNASRRNLREVLFFFLIGKHGTKTAIGMFQDDSDSHEKILRIISIN